MIFDWSEEKSEWLRKSRGISFEEIVVAIEEGGTLDILEHLNPSRYEGQRLYVVPVDNYAWVVSFVDQGDVRFLKTAFPSRKLTKRYPHGSEGKEDDTGQRREETSQEHRRRGVEVDR